MYDGTTGGPTTFLYLDDMAEPAGTLHPGVEYTLAIYTFGLPWALSSAGHGVVLAVGAAARPVAPAPATTASAAGPVSVLPEVPSTGP